MKYLIQILLLCSFQVHAQQSTFKFIGTIKNRDEVKVIYEKLKSPLLILDNRVYSMPGKCFERNFGGDQANKGRNFGGDQENNERNFGGDQANKRRNFGGDQENNERNFGGDQANKGRNFGGDQENNERNFGGDQANKERNFGGDQANNERGFGGENSLLKFKCDRKKGMLYVYLEPIQVSYKNVKEPSLYYDGIFDRQIKIEKY